MLEQVAFKSFLENYQLTWGEPKRVGIIAAGNLPLVCFHDILMTLLAGHICICKCSHQDKVLISYLRERWIEILPGIAELFVISDRLERLDFLISTGSNNTARYIEALYPNIPKLVRKNRFSVGILKAGLSENQMKGLAEDILLYNGLGCRNVSNLLIHPEADLILFSKILENYPQKQINPLYLERVLYERIRLEQLGGTFTAFPKINLKFSSQFSYASMGLIFGINIQQEGEKELLERHRDQIQVVVGRDIEYGLAQSPRLKDFADNVDTLKLLSTLSDHSA
ncbi:MAG: acyl-CoA reductase [Bacteroidota bacterium]